MHINYLASIFYATPSEQSVISELGGVEPEYPPEVPSDRLQA